MEGMHRTFRMRLDVWRVPVIDVLPTTVKEHLPFFSGIVNMHIAIIMHLVTTDAQHKVQTLGSVRHVLRVWYCFDWYLWTNRHNSLCQNGYCYLCKCASVLERYLTSRIVREGQIVWR